MISPKEAVEMSNAHKVKKLIQFCDNHLDSRIRTAAEHGEFSIVLAKSFMLDSGITFEELQAYLLKEWNSEYGFKIVDNDPDFEITWKHVKVSNEH